MNAPQAFDPNGAAHAVALDTEPRLREIPYNYTSFSDREIVIRRGTGQALVKEARP